MVSRTVSRRGLWDWLAQRLTAVLTGLYALFLLFYFIINHPISYEQWSLLFDHTLMRIFTFLVMASIVWHAWIGLWTVLTDYVKNRNVRLILEILIIIILLIILVWGLIILW